MLRKKKISVGFSGYLAVIFKFEKTSEICGDSWVVLLKTHEKHNEAFIFMHYPSFIKTVHPAFLMVLCITRLLN